MYASLIDYHCHLDLYPDFEQLVNKCEHDQIHTITVTTTPRAWPKNYELTKNLTYVRPALGLHPQLVAQHSHEIQIWDEYFPQAKYIGEVGLDASPAFYKSFQKQILIFDHIIKQCKKSGGKIITIHSVRSAQHVLNIMDKYDVARENMVVLHWFSGSLSEAKRALDMGCYFSVNSSMLSTARGRQLLTYIPTNRVLTETDGPFIKNHNKVLSPENVSLCVESLAEIWNLTCAEARVKVFENMTTLENSV